MQNTDNSFYASCEQAFNPALQGKPVVVLSNNDGCVIARSPEAKALGIGMAEPYFRVKPFCDKHRVAVFSSNYELYGDMSGRVMNVLANLTTALEVYSIDEAFLDLSGFDLLGFDRHALEITLTVKKHTGIPVSVGVAPTKTLAKVANEYAKKHTKHGVKVLRGAAAIDEHLKITPLGDVWGIGHRTEDKLKLLGISTAWDFAQMDARIVRQQFGVVYERTLRELQGFPCLSLEDMQPKKNICSSRSFSRPVTAFGELEEAVSVYMSRAAEKLRAQNSYARGVMVFIHTNRFRVKEPQYGAVKVIELPNPSNNTPALVAAAKTALRRGFRQGFQNQKAGVFLLDLVQSDKRQFDLFTPEPDVRREKLMAAMDKLNRNYGRHQVFFGTVGLKHNWQMRCDRRSPRYTTRRQSVESAS
ncbi:MAG: Y-family DNA polymerase [Tolypothrix sp. T3-bin4]|nr:Y-family DNA polymerase [Tolypothrix sp. Co-bin9]MBD0303653.1 Y-family DNA polymerase [Tolypothrix sp. T3-bin4]